MYTDYAQAKSFGQSFVSTNWMMNLLPLRAYSFVLVLFKLV